MVRSPSRGWHLALASCALTASGCISLSLGGKHDHLDMAGAVSRVAADTRFDTMESRIVSLEEGAKKCGCTESDPVMTETASATLPVPGEHDTTPAWQSPANQKARSR